MTKAVLELQENAVNEIYACLQKEKEVIFKAPTGSGKTIIMAKLMQKMLENDANLKFLVSSLSKGNLASQNYEVFKQLCIVKDFKHLKPFYISSGGTVKQKTQYSLDIEFKANVFVLPSNQYTKTSRIYKEKALLRFLENCKEKGQKIILIKDEAHISTNNLRELNEYFYKTLHFSATPKDDKFNVCIKESEAVEANLIKSVKFVESEKGLQEDLSEALDKFMSVREVYFKQGIRPCFIIQISNEIKGEQEMPIIKRAIEQKGLKWVCFVETEKDYESNSKLSKVKNKALWQKSVKANDSFIDVVIFKMVITEGFDMPRACMLFQVRNSQSKQLDEQVIGRVRRNPALLYFEKLDKQTQEIFSQALIYGIKPSESKKRVRVKLKGEIHKNLFENEIIKEFTPFKITTLKNVPTNSIDLSPCIDKERLNYFGKSIFSAFKDVQNADEKVREKYGEFVKSYENFFEFVANFNEIKELVKSVIKDYENNMQVLEVRLREDLYSFYEKAEQGEKFNNWIWANENDEDSIFSFDSEAEKQWCNVLESLANSGYCKSIKIKNKEKEEKEVYLFGKNFIDKSNIKYDYYDKRIKTSYPDFIFKDKKDNIHIFEVKSVNKNFNANINDEEYKKKIKALKEAYQKASLKTGYTFYLPIKTNDDWQIWLCEKGEVKFDDKSVLNKQGFLSYFRERLNLQTS